MGGRVTREGTLKHKLSTLFSVSRMGARNSSSVGRVRLSGVAIGPGRPHRRFSPITLRRLTSSVSRVNVVRPVALHGLDSSRCRVVTNRHHFHTSRLTKLADVPTCVHATSSRGIVRVTLVRGVRHRSLGSMRVTLTCRRLLRRCKLARRHLDRHINGGHAAVTGCLHLLGLPTPIRVKLRGGRVSVKRTHTLMALNSPGLRIGVFRRVLRRKCSMHGIRRVMGSLDRNRDIGDNNHGVTPGHTGLPRRFGVLGRRLSNFFDAGIRLAYSRGKGNGVDVPFGGRRRLRHVVNVLSALGGWVEGGKEVCRLTVTLLLYFLRVTKVTVCNRSHPHTTSGHTRQRRASALGAIIGQSDLAITSDLTTRGGQGVLRVATDPSLGRRPIPASDLRGTVSPGE